MVSNRKAKNNGIILKGAYVSTKKELMKFLNLFKNKPEPKEDDRQN